MIPEWVVGVLSCTCGARLARTEGNLVCDSCGETMKVNDDGIIWGEVVSDAGTDFHAKMERGTTLRELQHQEYHLANWETPYYKQAIWEFSDDVDLSSATALDVGCGDGRFTEYLIEQGAERVVAADANIHSLRSLAEHAEQEGYRENVVIVHADASLVPVLDETIDLVLSMGVLYYMNDRFEDGLSALVSKLRPGGQLIASEPDIEGVSLKALVFEGIEDFVEVFTDRRFVETHDSEPSKFRAFAKSEIRSLYEDAGLEVTGHQGLSLFPLLLAVRQARGEISDDEIAATDTELRQAFDTLNESGGVHKHVIWNCRKVAETDA